MGDAESGNGSEETSGTNIASGTNPRAGVLEGFVKHVLTGLLGHAVPLRKLFAPVVQLSEVF